MDDYELTLKLKEARIYLAQIGIDITKRIPHVVEKFLKLRDNAAVARHIKNDHLDDEIMPFVGLELAKPWDEQNKQVSRYLDSFPTNAERRKATDLYRRHTNIVISFTGRCIEEGIRTRDYDKKDMNSLIENLKKVPR